MMLKFFQQTGSQHRATNTSRIIMVTDMVTNGGLLTVYIMPRATEDNLLL